MLKNGLGEVLLREVSSRGRFFDLFTGSGAVASFVASQTDTPVHACDLQEYSVALAKAVICRNNQLDVAKIWRLWRARALKIVNRQQVLSENVRDPRSKRDVELTRRWSSQVSDMPITRAYGGHYFSALQSIWIDSLRLTLPVDDAESSLALAALIDAASECAASPGHTAQPFQPTKSAKIHLFDAWKRDVPIKVRAALKRMNQCSAKSIGSVSKGDAFDIVRDIRAGDLAFIDPPYSALHYSRFYHVLESIATGSVGDVEGVGRYPSRELRARSAYSVKRESVNAIETLLGGVAAKGADAIVTFPNHVCSNGLSGDLIKNISKKYFSIDEVVVNSRLSTLGGVGVDDIENEIRGSRRNASELIMILRSKKNG